MLEFPKKHFERGSDVYETSAGYQQRNKVFKHTGRSHYAILRPEQCLITMNHIGIFGIHICLPVMTNLSSMERAGSTSSLKIWIAKSISSSSGTCQVNYIYCMNFVSIRRIQRHTTTSAGLYNLPQ